MEKNIKFPENRRSKIYELIKEKKFLNTDEIINIFNLSRGTIIRDLVKLEISGLISRSYGGVSYVEPKPIYSFGISSISQVKEKEAIAKLALSLINNNDTIIVNPGSTTFELCKNLIQSKINTYLVTNSLKIMDLFAANNCRNILAIGGDLYLEDYGFSGQISNKVLEMIQGDTAFIGTNGIDLEEGLTLPISSETELVSIMAKRVKKRVILADYTKFGKTSLYKINIGFQDIDIIITDNKTDQKYISSFRDKGIEVLIAKV